MTDMVRISDARMSGTAYGTVVLHTAPEAAVGGPLALVQDGDIIELDVEQRLLQLHVSDEVPPPPAVPVAVRCSVSLIYRVSFGCLLRVGAGGAQGQVDAARQSG